MGKIKMNSIFTGTINKITSCTLQMSHGMICSLGFGTALGHYEIEKETYKEDAILIKVADCGYVDIDSINSIFDQLRIRKCLKKSGGFTLGDIILPDVPSPLAAVGDLYIERKSLQPYQAPIEEDAISLKELKKIKRK